MSRSITRVAGIVGGTLVLLAAALPAFGAPNPHPGLPAGVDAKLNTLLGMVMSVVIVACVGGVLVCAGKLALAVRHGEGAAAAGQLGAVAFACVLVGSGAGLVNYLV